MSEWGKTIRSIRELLRALAAGGRLVHRQAWRISQDSRWREWTVEHRDGTRSTVDARIAVTAHRKGLVSYEESAR